MTGLTDFVTEAKWEDILLIGLVLVDDAYQALEAQYGVWRRRGPQPVWHDREVMTLSLFIDTVFHGHEALGLAFLRHAGRSSRPVSGFAAGGAVQPASPGVGLDDRTDSPLFDPPVGAG